MKPKISTGYLTPQAKKTKNVGKATRGRLSVTEENALDSGFNQNIYEALMKCPEKKKMILQLLASNKDAIEKYKENQSKSSVSSPVGKLKNKRAACESPTALLRRRALEQMNSSSTTSSRSNSTRSDLSRSSSRFSEVSSGNSASSVPFNKILESVVAYVEIKNKDEDRSTGAKAVLKSMGAKLREKFTNDVTHVIFKDGSFMTYQKAKLMKIHLVSILWVEFCRKTMRRQSEKQYPALRSGFEDNETSMICSQMQKEYEDIIRDEYRKSIAQGTPLPSTRSFIDRRRTLMTPTISNLNSSSTSFRTAAESISSQVLSDDEGSAISGFHNNEGSKEESLVMNDPDCFSDVSGPMVNGTIVEKHNSLSNRVLKSVENVDCSDEVVEINTCQFLVSGNISPQKRKSGNDSDMELTRILHSEKKRRHKTSKSNSRTQDVPKLNGTTVEKKNSLFNCFLKSVENIDCSDKVVEINTGNISPEKCRSGNDSDMELTRILHSEKTPKQKPPKSDIHTQNIPKLPTKRNLTALFERRRTICNSLLSSNTSTTSLVSSDKTTSSDKSTNVADNVSFAVPKVSSKKSKRSSSNSFGFNESFEFGRNKAKSGKVALAQLDKTASTMSELHLSSNKHTSSEKKSENSRSSTKRSTSMSKLWLSSEQKVKPSERSTSMSDLCLSSERSKNNAEKSAMSTLEVSSSASNKIVENSLMSSLHVSSEDKNRPADNSSMSSLQVSTETKRSSKRKSRSKDKNTLSSDPSPISCLHISSEKVPSDSLSGQSKKRKSNNSSFSGLDESNTDIIKNLVQDVIKTLHTQEFVTVRKKSGQSTASVSRTSINSNDSEILSPRKNVRRTISRPSIGKEYGSDDNSTSDEDVSKNKKLELALSVTKGKRASRGLGKTVTKVDRKKSLDHNKVLVVNIVKSPLNNPQNNKHTSENKEAALTMKTRRRTLNEKGLNNTAFNKTFETSSNDKTSVENGMKSPDNLNSKAKNFTKEINKKIKNKKPGKKALNLFSSDSEKDISLNGKSKTDDSNGSSNTRKKLRKLYNPDDSIPIVIDDELERAQKRLEVRKRKSDEGFFINPIAILKSPNTHLNNTSIQNESIESESDSNEQTPAKRNKKGKKEEIKRITLNSSADEQRELLNEVINQINVPKVTPKTPKSVTKNNSKTKGTTPETKTPTKTPSRRKSIRIIKPTQKLIDSKKDEYDISFTPKNRRSTLDFQPTHSAKKKPKKVDQMKLPTIVCTKLHKSDVQVFVQIIKKLGKFAVEDEVSNRTTHLVAGESKRTINMLRAISRGCWVLKFEWVLQSLEEGKWLREEDFEVHDFSPAIQKSRLERRAFGATYTLDVFESCPPIYIGPSTNPRRSDLKELITICRGKVVTSPRMAKIIVGEYLKEEDAVYVNETWVLDCITFNKRMSFKQQYLLDKRTENKRKSLVV